jgi:uncharacterized protein
MMNLVTQESLKQTMQSARLSSSQVEAACQYLRAGAPVSFCHHYASEDAMGLSLNQWRKVKNYLHEQSYLQNLTDEHSKYLPQILRFLPFDMKLNQHLSFPNRLKNYPMDLLETVVGQILAHPEIEPMDVLKQHIADADEELLQDLRSVLMIKLLQSPELLQSLRQEMYLHAHVELKSQGKITDVVATLIADWPKPAPQLRKLNPSLALRFWNLKKSAALNLEFIHSKGPEWGYTQLANTLNWAHQSRLADAWIESAIQWIWDECLAKILSRDVLGMLYDLMVEQLLPVVELKWRQLLMSPVVGKKPLLLFYPHGKSGVMLLTVNASGEVLDEAMIYPFAPDYQAEHTLSYLAKTLIKFNIEDLVLVVKPETRRFLNKTLKTLKARYNDLQWHLHYLPGEYAQVLFSSHSKHPEVEDVLKLAAYAQNPVDFWLNISAEKWLPPSLQALSKPTLQSLWHDLLQAKLYVLGLDVNQASAKSFSALGLTSEQIEKLQANRPYESREALKNCLALDSQEFSYIEGMLRVSSSEQLVQTTPLLSSDDVFMKDFSKLLNCSEQDIFKAPKLLDGLPLQDAKRIATLLKSAQFKLHSGELNPELIVPGTFLQGVVTKVMNYGVFVELADGLEGLMHISAMGDSFLNDLNLLFQVGDLIVVEWLEYDATQKRLSLKFPLVKAVAAPPREIKVKNKPVFEKKTHSTKNKLAVPKPKPVEKKSQAPNAMQLAFAKLKTDNKSQ